MPGSVNHQNTQAIHHHTPTSQPDKLSRFLKALRKVSNDICTRFVDLFRHCFPASKPKKESTTSKTTQDDSQPLNDNHHNRGKMGSTENGLSTSAKSIIEEIMKLVKKHTEKHPADLKTYDSKIEYRHVFSQSREKGKTVLNGLLLPEKANVTKANLDGFKLICLNAQGADFRGSTMENTDISIAIMSKTNLNGLDLRTTNLFWTNFNGASLENVNFSGNKLLEFTRFSEANLQKANFNNTKLNYADFEKAKLEGADLTGADLTGADLTGADLTGADLTGAQLTGAQLTGAQLTGAQLTGAQLTGAQLTGAQLTGAQLTGAQLTGADLKDTDFTNADLRNVDMTEDELCASGAILTGAKVGNAFKWKEL